MREIALHILDLVQNSIRAEATSIHLIIRENITENQLVIVIQDNGKGMKKEMTEQVMHPFVTSRTHRKVGLGIPFVAQMCQECNGKMHITSNVGKGTRIEANLQYDHIDRLPLGDMAETMVTLILGKSSVHYHYEHVYESEKFIFDTDEIREILGEIDIENLEVVAWLKAYIAEQIKLIKV